AGSSSAARLRQPPSRASAPRARTMLASKIHASPRNPRELVSAMSLQRKGTTRSPSSTTTLESGNDHFVQNPWLQLPPSPPFIASCDAEALGRLRGKLAGDFELKLDL